jgi:hypothetical protein
MIVTVYHPVSSEVLQSIGGALAESLDTESISLFLSLSIDQDIASLASEPQRSDRFFQIPKKDLITFLISVEHSVAVTERKLVNGNIS